MEISCCWRVGVGLTLKKTLVVEKSGLMKVEVESVVRRRRVVWLEDLTMDWSFKERTRWRKEVPSIPSSRTRYGKKRTRSMYRANPGKVKRRRLRLDHVKENNEDGDP